MTTQAPLPIVQPSALTFTVYGIPIPKGSTKAFFRPGMKFPVVTHDNAKTRPWQESVVSAARDMLAGAPPLEGPIALDVRFFLPRPKSAPRRVVDATKKPDLDKLLRCVKDGLTRAGVYRDDAQVVAVVMSKGFAAGISDPDGVTGVPRAVVEVRGGGLLLSGREYPPGCPRPADDE
jgi:Holliday junction resolvase RusA-like endonuclease